MGCGKVVGFLLLFVLVVQCKVVLHGPTVYMEFEENLSLTKLASTPLENLLAKPATSLWYAQFLTKATKDKLIYVNATTPCAEKKYHKTGDAITFNWNGIKLEGTPYTVSAKLKVQLQTAPHGAAFHLSFEANGDSADNVSLWMWEVGVEQINVTLSHSVLQNAGFGFLHHCKSGGCQDWSDAYPQSTYQFLATYGARKHSGIYLASHDSHGEAKIFRCAVTKASERDIIPSSLSFYIASQPEGSGLGFKSYSVPYPIVLTTFSGNWWDASQIYREWVLPNADWTQRGTLRERADVPNWLLDLTIWVNSHWQELDILNRTGGEASVVKERVSNIARRFDIDEGGLGLHWYEWDTLGYTLGSDYSDCSTEVTCGFDTHYPEYFPARTGFDAAVKDLQDIGVRIAPYINGRIFDVATETWKRDQAEKWMAKKPKNPIFDPKDLELYEESYGSQAVFAVSCPDTDYWQDTIVNVTRRLLNVHAVDGIYIDQIAAAGPRLCWDPEHGHAIGGGHSWVDGYHKMLNGVRDAAGNNTMVLTESNAEPFMDGVDIYLSLVGFSGNFSGEERIVPVFPAIYGGYYISMGSVFFLEDLTHNTDVFAAKVAAQYLFGAQLGWFSLGGSDVQVPYMGMYEALMSPVYDPEVEFLKLLSRAKTAGNRWLQEGRAMRELLLVVNGTLPQKTVIQTPYHTPDHNQDYRMPHLHKPSLAFHSVMSAVWMDLKGESLLIALVTPKAGVGAHYYWKMNTVDFGFPVESYNQMFTLTQIFPEKKVIGDFKGCCVVQKALMEARSAITFVLTRK